MRIISITLCLFAISMVTVRADPEATAPDANQQQQQQDQQVLQVPLTPEQEALAKFQEGLDSLSELDFRLNFISTNEEILSTRLDQNQPQGQESGQVNTQGILDSTCADQKGALKTAAIAAKTALGVISTLPFGTTILGILNPLLDQVIGLVDGQTGVFAPILRGVAYGFDTLEFVMVLISTIPVLNFAEPVLKILDDLKPTVMNSLKCFFGSNMVTLSTLDRAMETSYHCGSLADMYRRTISDAAENSPALTLATDASTQVRRVTMGSLALLKVMKNTIAEKNEELLSTRPIFAADVLDQFREELSGLKDLKEIKNYADSYLVLGVGVTNALEACLRIQADPEGSVEELDAEIEAEEDLEDGNDDDDDEGEEENEDVVD